MKQWAIDNGARHYTHWFHPLTDGTAESTMLSLSTTAKAAWSRNSPASYLYNRSRRIELPQWRYTQHIRGTRLFGLGHIVACVHPRQDSLYPRQSSSPIPANRSTTRHLCYEPLNSVDKAATAVARYFDPEVKHVNSFLGWEQEYFLVDEALYSARPDLVMTGRTLMGHESAKTNSSKITISVPYPRVSESFMLDLEIECHKLGIPAKTRHNEVAPNQFELAPIFEGDQSCQRPQSTADVAHRRGGTTP